MASYVFTQVESHNRGFAAEFSFKPIYDGFGREAGGSIVGIELDQ